MLSTGQPARARRMLSAAGAACDGGTPRRAQAMLDEAATYRDPRHHGQVERVQGRIWHTMRRPADATAALLDAATELGPVDVRLARDILVEAVVQAQINGQLAPDGATPADVARVARVTPAAARDPGHGRRPVAGRGHDAAAARSRPPRRSCRQAISAARHEAGNGPRVLPVAGRGLLGRHDPGRRRRPARAGLADGSPGPGAGRGDRAVARAQSRGRVRAAGRAAG